MYAIGGYFELELSEKSNGLHSNALALNTARNALEYILKVNQYKKIYIPYFTCDAILEPISKLGISYSFYSIDEQLEPVFDFSQLEASDAFLYTNYFGLKNNYVKLLSEKIENLIIDNAQAFFAKPFRNESTYYSARKFFGVSDGAYLYTNEKLNESLDQDVSYERINHLLIRKDKSAEEGYSEFVKNDNSLINNDIKKMSRITKAILNSIDYNFVAERRVDNFNHLDSVLKGTNKFNFNLENDCVPMVYPYWSDDNSLKDRLLKNKVYCANYWPNVLEWCKSNALEYKLTNEVVYLPIDQRYNEKEMSFILKILKNEY